MTSFTKTFLVLAFLTPCKSAWGGDAEAQLFEALRDGKISLVEKLAKADGKINRPMLRQNGLSPLHVALSFGHEQLVLKLLELGADPNQAQNGGERATPLDLVAFIKDRTLSVRLGEILVSHGAELRPKIQTDDNLLLFAANAGNQEFLDWLIKKGLPVDQSAPGDRANTALGIAVSRKRLPMVRDLLQKGANPTRMFRQGSYLEILSRAKNVTSDDVPLAELLLNAGTNIHASDNEGNTALHFAVLNNNVALAKWLLAHAVAVEFNSQGQSPLTLAIKNHNYFMAEMMIQAGADGQAHAPSHLSARQIEERSPDPRMHAILNKLK